MAGRRKNGAGTIRKRKDGRWEGRVVVSYKENGDPVTKNVLAKTRTECQNKLNELIEKTLPPSKKLAPDMPFGVWIDFWYQNYVKPGVRESTRDAYENNIYNHIIPELGKIPLNQLSESDLQQFYSKMLKSGRVIRVEQYGEGLSASIVRKMHVLCGAALEKAIESGFLRKNPNVGCKLPPKRGPMMQILSIEEMQRFLIQAKYDGLYELYLLELSTGLRLGELLALQWKDINFKTGALHVSKQLTTVHGKATISEPKTPASIRTVYLSKPVLEVLRAYGKSVDSDWMFPSQRRNLPLHPSAIRKRLKGTLERAECKNVRFHDLRHTFATMALENGMDVKTLSEMLGHVSAATTLDVYSHVTDTMEKQAAIKIDRKFGKGDAPLPQEEKPKLMDQRNFQAVEGNRRRPGTGCLHQIGDHLWEGRYSYRDENGKRVGKNVYAKTKEECELKLDKIEDPVTEKSNASIGAARKAYDNLTSDQKKLVTNVKKLTDAEKAYAQLTATPEDKEKAQKVIDLINKLTDVTLDSEKDVEAARKAYDALTDLQKLLVDNYDILVTAETKLAMLKALGKVSDPYITTGDYMEALGTPGVGSTGGEWMVIGLARSGRNVPGVEDYYQKVVEYVKSNIDPDTGRLHKAKSTDNSRIIMALTAIGKDVTNVGGYNLLAGLSDFEYVKYQGNNGPIWALLALDSGNYPVPSGGTTTRQALIEELLRIQTSDGGWAVSGDKADSDMTGMALTALAPYYKKDLKVQQAIDKAITCLSEMQDDDGGFSTTYSNGEHPATSESISQVVTALSALGINADTDPRFIKNGSSVIDALLRYYVEGGGFRHIMDGDLDGIATEQAYYALTAYYRFLTGQTNLYDMTDIIDMGGDPVEPTVPATTEPTEVEPAKTGFPWWILVVCVVGGCGLGMVIAIVIIPKFGKFKKKD